MNEDDVDTALAAEFGWTASEALEAWERVRRAFAAAGWPVEVPRSDDPGLSPDAARWTPEDD